MVRQEEPKPHAFSFQKSPFILFLPEISILHQIVVKPCLLSRLQSVIVSSGRSFWMWVHLDSLLSRTTPRENAWPGE
jgi:hypothetical protein